MFRINQIHLVEKKNQTINKSQYDKKQNLLLQD